MRLDDMSPSLQERLGPQAAVGLLALFETAHQRWSGEVTSLAIDRFERRITEEAGKLRMAITEGNASLRVELKDDMHKLDSTVTRWTFALWVGQVVATAAIVAAMLQIYGP